ncbi:MAG: glycosyltransferase, partial [Muribaculaceae bacterium]|nr:glycosyltransferase [Muribaculaceae bacterium]
MSKTISIVVPCYNEEAALQHTMPQLLNILNRLSDEGKISSESFVLCVDDGSRDKTWDEI